MKFANKLIGKVVESLNTFWKNRGMMHACLHDPPHLHCGVGEQEGRC